MSWNLLKALLKNYAEAVITLAVRFSTGILFYFESPSLFPLTPTPRPCQVCHCLLHLNVFHLRLTVSSTFVHRRKSFPLCDAGFVSSFCASFFPAFFTLVCVCACVIFLVLTSLCDFVSLESVPADSASAVCRLCATPFVALKTLSYGFAFSFSFLFFFLRILALLRNELQSRLDCWLTSNMQWGIQSFMLFCVSFAFFFVPQATSAH